jgi:hypothetical protein
MCCKCRFDIYIWNIDYCISRLELLFIDETTLIYLFILAFLRCVACSNFRNKIRLLTVLTVLALFKYLYSTGKLSSVYVEHLSVCLLLSLPFTDNESLCYRVCDVLFFVFCVFALIDSFTTPSRALERGKGAVIREQINLLLSQYTVKGFLLRGCSKLLHCQL